MKLSKRIHTAFAAGLIAAAAASGAQAQSSVQGEVAVAPPVFLQLEITSACTEDGAVFKIINRGKKWPQTGFLRLYHADDKTLISERKLRLGDDQKASFVVKKEIAAGRPVGVWIEPEWYARDFEYDARIDCK